MAKVRVARHVRISGRKVPVKRVPAFAPILEDTQAEATAVQLRVLAEEAREMLLDKLFAGSPQSPAKARLTRPGRLRRPDILGSDRDPFDDHEPATEGHIKKKARREQDGRSLLMTGDYAENGIEVFRGVQRSGVYYMVRPARGLHKGEESSGPITYRMLAMVHEFGSARHKIPPRPHWKPVAREVIERFKRARRTVRADQLRRMLRRLK